MKTKLKLLLLALSLSGIRISNGQTIGSNCCLPPVSIPTNVHICDPEPYKLVFFDDFNGSRLNAPWITFNSWASMPGGDNENWKEGRKGNPGGTAIVRNENVIVNDGTCKLLIKKQPGTWVCSSCLDSERVNGDYTVGIINLPYTGWNFNSGKFEAKIKFPTFKGFWGAFWLWHGNSVNEIDIAEAIGTQKSWPYLGTKAHAKVTYDLHAWSPALDHAPDPYLLERDADLPNEYPNQSWWNFVVGNNFKQNDWHTYTCEWDTGVIKTYLDGNQLSVIWKYFQEKPIFRWFWGRPTKYYYNVGSDCNPDPGIWKVCYGFPYNNKSYSQLRIGASTEGGDRAPNGSGTLGQMEIDYVKVWQRHPDADGHTDLCNVPTPVLSGPNIICNKATFTASPASVTGNWEVAGGSLAVGSTSNNGSVNTAEINRNTASPLEYGIVKYTYSPAGCPSQSITKVVDVGPPNNPYVFCTRTLNGSQETFNLFALRPYGLGGGLSPTTYEWDIDYVGHTGCTNALHYHAFGQFVSTPPYPVGPGYDMYCVKWKVKVTNACGSIVKEGQQDYMQKYGNKMANTGSDPTAYYYDAIITDSAAYEQNVYDRVARKFVDNSEDTVAISSMIEQVRAEELAPYILLPEEEDTTTTHTSGRGITSQLNTKIYPNPSSDLINILFGKKFSTETELQIDLTDVYGVSQLTKLVEADHSALINLDISSLANGTYMVSLRQNGYTEVQKFLKQ